MLLQGDKRLPACIAAQEHSRAIDAVEDPAPLAIPAFAGLLAQAGVVGPFGEKDRADRSFNLPIGVGNVAPVRLVLYLKLANALEKTQRNGRTDQSCSLREGQVGGAIH